MLHHLIHTDIDKIKWDKSVDQSLTPLPYAYSWYLDIVCPGWEALADEDYKNIMPLPWRKKAGIKYLYQPFFTQQFGVFQVEKNVEIIKEALSLVKKNFQYAELQMNYSNHFDLTGLQYKKRANFHIDLNLSYEDIKKSYNNNLKRNLQKASTQSLEISEAGDAPELIKIFRETKGSYVRELEERDYNTLAFVCKTAREKNCGGIYMVNSGSEILAAAFFLINHKYIVNLFPASTLAGKENFAMHFLLDSIIMGNSLSNKIFDFEGTDIPSLAQFYKSFGPVDVPYLKIWINQLPWHLRLLKSIKDGL